MRYRGGRSTGLSTGWRLLLRRGPVKMGGSLFCSKPQFFSLTLRSKADFEGGVAPVRDGHLGSQGDLCVQTVRLYHRQESLGLTLEAVARYGP